VSQTLIPTADAFVGANWTRQSTGLGSNLYLAINEDPASADNSDYAVQSLSAGANAAYVFQVPATGAPSDGTVAVDVVETTNGSTSILMEIREGYVDESNKGTLLGSVTYAFSTSGFPRDSHNISITGATSATLFCRVVVTNTSASVYAISAWRAAAPDSTVTGSGAPVLEQPASSGAGSIFWNYTGTVVLPRPSGTGAIVIPPPDTVGQVAVGTVNGQRVAGIVLELDGDGLGNPLVLYGINPASTGQQIRWYGEGIMSNAEGA
jgi:hypothetical protein